MHSLRYEITTSSRVLVLFSDRAEHFVNSVVLNLTCTHLVVSFYTMNEMPSERTQSKQNKKLNFVLAHFLKK
jgi:hypothetical protein